jgi:non-specific serine/threonine protein kinase
MFILHLSPRGTLLPLLDADAPLLPEKVAQDLKQAFTRGAGHALLHLGAVCVDQVLPPVWGWWRDFAVPYVTALCALPELAAQLSDSSDPSDLTVALPAAEVFNARVADAPPMPGAEYLTADVLTALWRELDAALRLELPASRLALPEFLKSRNPLWNRVGRVHFNLAENRKDADYPFAFLATYTGRLSAQGRAQHQPLSQALAEFSGAKNKPQLLSLLLPVQRAAGQCDWLSQMVSDGDVYHPLRWTAAQAFAFLRDVGKLEAAGVVVRMPGVWAAGRPSRPMVKGSVGTRQPSLVGAGALLDFSMEVSLDGETLSAGDIQQLLKAGDGLQLIRGRWVEVNQLALQRLVQRFEAIETAAADGLPYLEAVRLLAGASLDDKNPVNESRDAQWSEVVAGDWLAETLQGLRQPEGLARVSPGTALKATLRPYQEAGVRWLYLLTRLGLGACLADDMGLGKTIQVLSLLLVLKKESSRAGHKHAPSLLVVPASLLANWAAEAEKFAPSLGVFTAHPSALSADDLKALDVAQLSRHDLVLTSYGTLLRLPALLAVQWALVVADEAQAIKNPAAKQTAQLKKLQAASRIALTGTPVENRLSDLWSIFDFTHPGLLGNSKTFTRYAKRLAEAEHFGPLRSLVQPYILRRMKTDKRVIADLPDKTELKAWCHLSKTQAALYQRAVKELAAALESTDGIQRKGLVLSYLMRFKQICNHPSQWLGDGAWAEGDSGKFARLRELVEVIAAKQEKVLVFTQFRETTQPLAAFLGSIFGREGLVLHGGTPVAQRQKMVKRFQEDELLPFFVLSIKAGGAGLNLTAASHVIHFDRWWNPAVENQATDRAFRIGQKRNVLVHKFVCQGTVEDRIDQLIESKQKLVNDLLEGGSELQLTEMSNADLLSLVRLDIHAAQDS